MRVVAVIESHLHKIIVTRFRCERIVPFPVGRWGTERYAWTVTGDLANHGACGQPVRLAPATPRLP